MNRVAVFPGSFDPITFGHVAVIKRALPLFDKIIIAVGINTNKTSMFTIEQRLSWMTNIFKSESKIEVLSYEGLTIDLCNKVNSKFILRGLRSTIDFEYERSIAQMNKDMEPTIETIFLLTDASYSGINSSIVREIIKNKGDISKFVPAEVKF